MALSDQFSNWNPSMGLSSELKSYLADQVAKTGGGMNNPIKIGNYNAIGVAPGPTTSELNGVQNDAGNFDGAYTFYHNNTPKWFPGITAQEFNATTGNLNREFTWDNPAKRSPMEKLTLAFLAAVSGGAAGAAMGAAGAAGGGLGGAAEGAGGASFGTGGALTGSLDGVLPAGMGYGTGSGFGTFGAGYGTSAMGFEGAASGLAGGAGASSLIPGISNQTLANKGASTLLNNLTSGGGSSPTPVRHNTGGTQMPNLFNSLGSLFGGSGSSPGGNSGLEDIINQLGGAGNIGANLIPGIVDAQRQGQASQKFLDFLNSQQSKMDAETKDSQSNFMNFLQQQQGNVSNAANSSRDSFMNWLNGQQQALLGETTSANQQFQGWLGQQGAGLNQQAQGASNNILNTLTNQGNQVLGLAQQGRQGTLDWLNQQQARIDGLYAQGSPEQVAMQREMEAKDAAAGRNSQYGTRAVDLGAKLAGIKGGLNKDFAVGVANTLNSANMHPADSFNSFASNTAPTMGQANLAPVNTNANFVNSSIQPMSTSLNSRANMLANFDQAALPSVAQANNLPAQIQAQFAGQSLNPAQNSMSQGAGNTLQFTTGTSRGLAEALNQNASRFSSLLGGLGVLNQRNQAGPDGIGNGSRAPSSTNPFGSFGNGSSLINSLFGHSTDPILDEIENNGWNTVLGPGASSPTPEISDSIFNSFGGGGGFDSFPTHGDFGGFNMDDALDFGNDFDFSDWFQ